MDSGTLLLSFASCEITRQSNPLDNKFNFPHTASARQNDYRDRTGLNASPIAFCSLHFSLFSAFSSQLFLWNSYTTERNEVIDDAISNSQMSVLDPFSRVLMEIKSFLLRRPSSGFFVTTTTIPTSMRLTMKAKLNFWVGLMNPEEL